MGPWVHVIGKVGFDGPGRGVDLHTAPYDRRVRIRKHLLRQSSLGSLFSALDVMLPPQMSCDKFPLRKRTDLFVWPFLFRVDCETLTWQRTVLV
jgi:hypothetical protein